MPGTGRFRIFRYNKEVMTTAARKHLIPSDWTFQCWAAEVEAEISTEGWAWFNKVFKHDPVTCRDWFNKCFARQYNPEQAGRLIERAVKVHQEKFQKLFVAG